MNRTQMRKEIYNRTAYLLSTYPVNAFVSGMGYEWETLSETEQRRWEQAFGSVVQSMKISGRDESVKK